MLKFKVAAALLFFPLSVFAAETKLHWRGHEFREIRSLSAVPAEIQRQLGFGKSGLEGVADKGQAFNTTDVVVDSLPMRRFLAAGRDGVTWLIALEKGGYAYNVQVYLFSGNKQRQHWVLLDRPLTLQAVLRQIPRPASASEDSEKAREQ